MAKVKGDNPAAGFIICSIVLLGARSDARALAHSGDLFRFGFVERICRHASNSRLGADTFQFTRKQRTTPTR
jgi:hypothetical protein